MTFVAFAPAAVQPFAVAFVCYLSWNYNSVHDRWFKYTWSRVSYISLEHSHYCSRKGTCSRKDCTVCQTINRQAGNNVCVQDLRYIPKEQFWHSNHDKMSLTRYAYMGEFESLEYTHQRWLRYEDESKRCDQNSYTAISYSHQRLNWMASWMASCDTKTWRSRMNSCQHRRSNRSFAIVCLTVDHFYPGVLPWYRSWSNGLWDNASREDSLTLIV